MSAIWTELAAPEFLNRVGDSSVERTVCWVLPWPRYPLQGVSRPRSGGALSTGSRQETSNVNVAVAVHVGPDNCWTIAIRLGYNC
jgi:hypothetical protein